MITTATLARADGSPSAPATAKGLAGIGFSRLKRWWSTLCLTALLAFSATLSASAGQTLAELPHLRSVGAGSLTWFGLTVYRAMLYAPDGEYRHDHPHAITITYEMAFDSEQLARASLDEIERMLGERPDAEKLLLELESVLSDVGQGDSITGVHYPGQGAEFYTNGKFSGQTDDAELAAAFFAIWLDPRTSEPGLRTRLLGNRS